MCVYTEDENSILIDHILCDTNCVWKGNNIIGMLIKDFIRKYSLHPVLEEGEPTYVLNKDGHNTQRIFQFKEEISFIYYRKKIAAPLFPGEAAILFSGGVCFN